MKNYSQYCVYLSLQRALCVHFKVCGTIRTLTAVGGAQARAALSRAVSFPESGGRSVVVVVYPPLERPTQRAGRVQELQDGGQRRADGVSAPNEPLRWDAGFRSVFAVDVEDRR